MPTQTQSQVGHGMHHILALPEPLLELILIPGTSTKDKKALRKTCKMFRNTMDGRMKQLFVRLSLVEYVHGHLESFLKHIQHLHGLRISIAARCNEGSLFDYMPDNLKTLRIVREGRSSLEPLSRLRHLTALDILASGWVSGLHTISGLTSLRCYYSDVGSVAHLAPTLKRLSISKYNSRLHLEQLTILTTLTVQEAPTNFFATHRRLPLKHLYIRDQHRIHDADFWQQAPLTLAGLTLYGTPNISPAAIPVTITHLQLLDADDVIDQALTALPQLKRLDIFSKAEKRHVWHAAFNNLCRHTNLQDLNMCVVQSEAWQRDPVLTELPEVAKAVGKGVKLNVVDGTDELLASFQDPCIMRSAWSIYT